jgi:hypothetical protein
VGTVRLVWGQSAPVRKGNRLTRECFGSRGLSDERRDVFDRSDAHDLDSVGWLIDWFKWWINRSITIISCVYNVILTPYQHAPTAERWETGRGIVRVRRWIFVFWRSPTTNCRGRLCADANHPRRWTLFVHRQGHRPRRCSVATCRCVAWLRVFTQSMQYLDPANTGLSWAIDCRRLLAYMHDFFVQVMEHGHRLHQTEKILSQFILSKVHYHSVHGDSNCCAAFARPPHVARRMTYVQLNSASLMRTARGSEIISPPTVPALHPQSTLGRRSAGRAHATNSR